MTARRRPIQHAFYPLSYPARCLGLDGPKWLDRLQDILTEDGQRDDALQVISLVEIGIDDDHEVEFRRDVQALPTPTDADGPVNLLVLDR